MNGGVVLLVHDVVDAVPVDQQVLLNNIEVQIDRYICIDKLINRELVKNL